VVVPVRDISAAPACVRALAAQRYPSDLVEVFIVHGDAPSVQRNRAAALASGEFLYFLDDDSELDPHALAWVLECYREWPDVGAIGGPSVIKRGAPLKVRSFGVAMGSVFGLGPARHRYHPSGLIRAAGENELIGCNLSVRRALFEAHGGFDPRLYPSEENEWMNRLRERGVAMLYHPLAVVTRNPRDNFRQLLVQHLRYGMGRTAHLRLRPEFINVVLLVPLLFVLYLGGLGVALATRQGLPAPRVLLLWLAPLVAYAQFLLSAALFGALTVKRGRLRTFLLLLAVYPIIHLSYGVGSMLGFLRRAPRAAVQPHVRLFCAKRFAEPYPALAGADWLAELEELSEVSPPAVARAAS
jgi:cellulose synthase/poly-beta-1,6-N-acetylglucosamine synthase-like glycosyltransferase